MLSVFDPDRVETEALDALSRRAWQIVRERQRFEGKQKRRQHRDALVSSVYVQPVNRRLQPTLAPFCTVTTNIPDSGICFVTEEPFTEYGAQLVLHVATGEALRPLVRRIRCTPTNGVYEIGCSMETTFDDLA